MEGQIGLQGVSRHLPGWGPHGKGEQARLGCLVLVSPCGVWVRGFLLLVHTRPLSNNPRCRQKAHLSGHPSPPPECRKDSSAPSPAEVPPLFALDLAGTKGTILFKAARSLRTPPPWFLHCYMDFLLLPGACLLERGCRSPIPVGRTISEGAWRDFPGGSVPKTPSSQCRGAGV